MPGLVRPVNSTASAVAARLPADGAGFSLGWSWIPTPCDQPAEAHGSLSSSSSLRSLQRLVEQVADELFEFDGVEGDLLVPRGVIGNVKGSCFAGRDLTAHQESVWVEADPE